jgi:hypothetical protein
LILIEIRVYHLFFLLFDFSSTSTTTTATAGSSVHSSSPSSSPTTISASITANPATLAVTLDSWRYYVDGAAVAPVALPVSSDAALDPDVVPTAATSNQNRR